MAANFNVTVDEKSASNSKDVIVNNLSINAYKRDLFKEANLKLVFGKHYGLIGKNGIGKTTLLNHIYYRKIPISKDMDILYVEQEVAASEKSVFDVVMEANEERLLLIKKKNELEDLLENEENVLEEYEIVMEHLRSIGADKDESIVKRILFGLGFRDFQKPAKEFSGGWRMRIALAKALYMQPTLLLLDEPTNHLDLCAVIWLTEYLKKYPKTLLVVSHNRDFLNQVCSDIIHIERNKLVYYRGNFDKFQRDHEKKIDKEEKDWNNLQKKIKNLQKKNITKKEVKKMIEESNLQPPEKRYRVKINFYPTKEISSTLITAKKLSFGYLPDELLFWDIDIKIEMNSRIALVGENGAGKSTLINLLAGFLLSPEGEINRNPSMRIGYYNQHFIEQLPLEKSPMVYIKEISLLEANKEQDVRRMLGEIGLPGETHLFKIGDLSGGQKARVAIVALYVQKPHLLLLDEPTNHLDMESIDSLIEGINGFNGAVVMISHNLDLIAETECEIWALVGGNLELFEGSTEDYREIMISDE